MCSFISDTLFYSLYKCASCSDCFQTQPKGITQINDMVYELYRPDSPHPEEEARPEIEVIFFHGLQASDYKKAYWKTWLSRDKSVIWPKDWLSKDFPTARILSISYNSTAWGHPGPKDTEIIAENLVTNIIRRAGIGQNCPVILVGHSLGGIVIKEFLLKCFDDSEDGRVQTFVENCRGIFYYSTPQSGSLLAKYVDRLPGKNDPLIQLLKEVNRGAARINDDFANARNYIRTAAIGEALPTRFTLCLRAKIVEESAARVNIDKRDYYTANADHFSVCKPVNKMYDNIYLKLTKFIRTSTE